MYSKVGKYTTNQNRIFKEKPQILSRQLRKYVMKKPKFIVKSLIPLNKLKQIIAQAQDQSNLKTSNNPTKISISFSSQSREQYYTSSRLRDQTPPLGHYNSNYDLLQPKSRNAYFKVHSKTQSRIKSQSVDLSEISPQKPSFHIQSPSFDKQLPRKSIFETKKESSMQLFKQNLEAGRSVSIQLPQNQPIKSPSLRRKLNVKVPHTLITQELYN